MAGELKLNAFCRLHFADRPEVDLLLDGHSVELPSVDALVAVACLATPSSREDAVALVARETGAPPEAADRLIGELLKHRVLVDAAEHQPELAHAEHWISRGWFEALVFHLRSRGLKYADVENDAEGIADDVLAERFRAAEPPSFSRGDARWPVVALPAEVVAPDPPLEDVLLRRRSNEPWAGPSLELSALAGLLRMANATNGRQRRLAQETYEQQPSALLKSPFADIETYVLAHAVTELPAGMYHYDPLHEQLSQVQLGDHREIAQRLCIGQERAGSGSVSLVMTVTWKDAMLRYAGDPNAYRATLVALGELGQRYLVAATALGLSTFLTPALDVAVGEGLLGASQFVHTAMYVIACG